MHKAILLTSAFLLVLSPALIADDAVKKSAVASVENQRPDLIKLSDQIWHFAETALRETKSAAVLAEYAERMGFSVERGVAGMPTAFVASYGSGRPIIGILGEFDALPGLSQKAQSSKETLVAGAPGHGCGHNMFGAASLGAATAIKQQIEAGNLKGTIRFYATPAEESVGGKIYMAREGLFSDLDVCLAWHPGDETMADTTSSQALIDFIVEFHGKSAHAAADPWNGRSAVDGLELFTHGINMLREHVKPTVRIHYTIVNGGQVPNVIPEYAKVWCWARDMTRDGVEDVFARIKDVAKGAATMAGVKSELTVISGDYEILPNTAGSRLLNDNLHWLGPIEFTKSEHEFARAIQKATGKPETGLSTMIHPLEGQEQTGGSSDVGDVSWIAPVIHLSVTTAPEATPWHSWPVVACGGMSIGHTGMTYAAKALAATAVDLYENADLVTEIRAEFKKRVNGHVHKPYIPDGPPPIPKD
jgi:aminobenzoyl-glutamate utilization protein B